MAIGRPTDYTEELLSAARDYLENYEEHGDAIPSIAGLSVHIKKARSTIYAWRDEEGKEEFSDILDEILSKQEQVLINKGLTGDFNASITKLALGKHGYTDKQDVTSGNKPIQNTWTVMPVTTEKDG